MAHLIFGLKIGSEAKARLSKPLHIATCWHLRTKGAKEGEGNRAVSLNSPQDFLMLKCLGFKYCKGDIYFLKKYFPKNLEVC